MSALIGRYLADRYRILQKVGEGGMGEVFAAEDVRRDRLVAVKVMRKDTQDPAAAERMLREAEVLARLRAPQLVRLFDFRRDMDLQLLFVAMEFAVGDDLIEILRHGRLPYELVLSLLAEVGQGLAHAHRAGIVHRDIKPANIKLRARRDGTLSVKILDFGLVRDSSASAVLTDMGQAPGTVTYMQPEVFDGGQVDSRSDLYSLGVVAYEMLAGTPPFVAASPVEVAGLHLREEPASLGKILNDVPEEVCALVHDLLVKNPEQRVQDAETLVVRSIELQEKLEAHPYLQHHGPARHMIEDWGVLPRFAEAR